MKTEDGHIDIKKSKLPSHDFNSWEKKELATLQERNFKLEGEDRNRNAAGKIHLLRRMCRFAY